MRLNIECKEPEIILNILRNLFVNEEVTLTKKYSSTADYLPLAMKQSIHWKVSWSLPRIFRHIK